MKGIGRAFLFLLCVEPFVNSFDFLMLCYEECRSKATTEERDFDLACNETCKIQKCFDGCESVKNDLLSSPCQNACEEDNITGSKSWNIHCMRGCGFAISVYISRMKEEFGKPPAPYLVADSCTHDAVTIQWISAPFANISYLVQWRYGKPHPALEQDWKYYEFSNILKSNQVTLRGLQPYTNYKFRVAWILLKSVTPLFSEESVAISTLPRGAPSVSPIITCLNAIRPSCISIEWEPPAFPNGPVLSYVLYVRDYSTGAVMIKDIPALTGEFQYIFNNLVPSTTYVVSIAARNNVGEGPAYTKNISMPAEDSFSDFQKQDPYLVFAARQSVLKQGIHILDGTTILYYSNNDSAVITDVAMDVKENSLFVSDSVGLVHQIQMDDEKLTKLVIAISSYQALLSVDWLNKRLYIAENSQISICTYEGQNYELVLTDLMYQITDIHVDPYNGFLFWAAKDDNVGGIYRVDLADLQLKALGSVERIVKDCDILSFAIDFVNFQLFAPSAEKNTIIAAAMDGSSAVNIRNNSQTSQFTGVKSIIHYQHLFYWTDGKEIFAEEYHKSEDRFYHNTYSSYDGPFSSINLYHPNAQPEPVPLMAVDGLEVMFLDKVAKLRWLEPRISSRLGKGAWRNWMYEVHLTDLSTRSNSFEGNIIETTHVLNNLKSNTSYGVRIRAYSYAGKGPWSSAFIGRTLKIDNFPHNPFILWSTAKGLVKSNVIGENAEDFIIGESASRITGITSFDGKIFLNMAASFIYVHDVNGNHSRLNNIKNAVGIAIDWFAPKIYWSNHNLQMIFRANLDGSQTEALPVPTTANQLAIDSPAGFIYWATSLSIECARLNGDGHFSYMKNEAFSGKLVTGLTLDFDRRYVYFTVKNDEGFLIYRTRLAGSQAMLVGDAKLEILGLVRKSHVSGPVWYFNDRLLWIHHRKEAFISDIKGKNIAAIRSLDLSGLETLAIIDPALQPFPDGLPHKRVKVVPPSVDRTSIIVSGTSSSFNISWNPVQQVNYGPVYYEVKVDNGKKVFSLVTERTVCEYPADEILPPFSHLTVTIKAYTYWASSQQTILSINTPVITNITPDEDQQGVIIASTVSVFILLMAFSVAIYQLCRYKQNRKKGVQDMVYQNRAPELSFELSTLHELPQHSTFVHQTNALYTFGTSLEDEDFSALPQVERSQIIFTKFLGSGAFGEVFEGIARDLSEDSSTVKIAIKTLRKGATDHEKQEFLKEAKLMSNFRHDHILQLLGVCFDNNPNFIILELMEGGDLLAYLRNNRPCIYQRCLLSLADLYAICSDVAQGCKYLEDMHFVHRDLAARNCLVSSYNRKQRVVKIGDFGLARDIYKNDYYRKEGEGLLPVRWMAPESLMYGIFTSQSDVWAFGVLLWEVMTLGQQPYPARSNVEVLHYVKAGGCLDKPDNCPEDMNDIMMQCWSYNPTGRPSFNDCLRVLEELKCSASFIPSAFSAEQSQLTPNNSSSSGYIFTVVGSASCDLVPTENENEDAISAKNYQVKRCSKSSLLKQSAYSNCETNCGVEEDLSLYTPFATKTGCNANKYLELLGDNEDADGYEIPLQASSRHIPSPFEQGASTVSSFIFSKCDSNKHQKKNQCISHPTFAGTCSYSNQHIDRTPTATETVRFPEKNESNQHRNMCSSKTSDVNMYDCENVQRISGASAKFVRNNAAGREK